MKINLLVILFLPVVALAWQDVEISGQACVQTMCRPVVGKAASLLPSGKRWKLVWHDEFDGQEIDRTKWMCRESFWGKDFPAFAHGFEGVEMTGETVRLHLLRKGNEFCSPHLQTGSLTYDIPKDTDGFWPFGSYRKPLFMHKYGYYEIRCRQPKYPGWHSAFWLQAPGVGSSPDPSACGVETDIMENYRQHTDGKIVGGNGWNGYGKDSRWFGHFSWDYEADADGWCYYGVDWTPNGYTFYANGKKIGEQNDPVSHTEQFVLVSTEPGGYRKVGSDGGLTSGRDERTWGKPDPRLFEVVLPDYFEVDFVRVYDEVSSAERVEPVAGDATVAIQSAIDRVWLAGGGRVSVAAGEYATKGLRLRSNVELHLERNAVLNASRNCDDFAVMDGDALEPVPENLRDLSDYRGGSAKRLSHWCNGIIRLFCATNAAITGEPGSAIDGCNSYSEMGEEKYRGVHGICADFSTNVVVRGIELRNTGNWATRFFDCADLRFEDMRIRGGHDGVHVRGCDRVSVVRCDIRSGDDCIAGFDNADVQVSDCTLNSACSAFRFGGTHVRVSRCRVWGPAEWPFRGNLTKADKAAGVSSQGRGRDNLLSFWTYFADFSRPIRNPPGDIIVTDCTVENADRFLHYNFSGNETWQKGAPLGDIRFERIRAKNIGMSLCAYADAERPLALVLIDSEIAFREPQAEFVRAANIGSIVLRNVSVSGVNGPSVRTWAGEPSMNFSNVKGLSPKMEKSDKPFTTESI